MTIFREIEPLITRCGTSDSTRSGMTILVRALSREAEGRAHKSGRKCTLADAVDVLDEVLSGSDALDDIVRRNFPSGVALLLDQRARAAYVSLLTILDHLLHQRLAVAA